MALVTFLIIVAVQLLDPFKVIPVLLISYHAKSRWGAIGLGAAVCFVVSFLTTLTLHGQVDGQAAVFWLASVVVGAALPAILWPSMSRWRERRRAAKAAPATPPSP